MSTSENSLDLLTHTYIKTVAIIASVCFLSSCALWDASGDSPVEQGDADQASDISQMDTGRDAHSEKDIVDDAAGDTPDSSPCQNMNLGKTFDMDSSQMMPQSQPRVAFDGDGVWVVYVRPADLGSANSAHDIYATRLSCGEGDDVPPTKINTRSILREFPAPSISIKNQTVYIAWNSIISVSSRDAIFYRAFSSAGQMMMSEEKEVELQINAGDPAPLRFSDGDIVALSGERAVVVGTGFRVDEAQVYAQKVTHTGQIKGKAMAVDNGSDTYKRAPSVTATSSEEIWLSWHETVYPLTGLKTYNPAFRSLDLNNPTSNASVTNSQRRLHEGRKVDFARHILDPEQIWAVFVTTGSESFKIHLLNAAVGAESIVVADQEGTNDFPSVAASETGGAVAWYYRGPLGARERELQIRAFGYQGGAFDLKSSISVSTHDSHHFYEIDGGPSIVHLGGDYYFVAWSEGITSRAFMESRVKGRFIEL